MLGFTTLLSAASLLAIGANAVIDTPSGLVTCQPTLLSWGATTAPYYLTVIPNGDTSTTLASLVSGTDDLSYTWTVNIASGTEIAFALKDGTGASLYTAGVTIGAGTDTSCLNSTSSSTTAAASATTSAASTTGAVASASSEAVSAASSASTKAATVSAAVSSASAAATSAVSSGASSLSASVALSALGLVTVGFFALA